MKKVQLFPEELRFVIKQYTWQVKSRAGFTTRVYKESPLNDLLALDKLCDKC